MDFFRTSIFQNRFKIKINRLITILKLDLNNGQGQDESDPSENLVFPSLVWTHFMLSRPCCPSKFSFILLSQIFIYILLHGIQKQNQIFFLKERMDLPMNFYQDQWHFEIAVSTRVPGLMSKPARFIFSKKFHFHISIFKAKHQSLFNLYQGTQTLFQGNTTHYLCMCMPLD